MNKVYHRSGSVEWATPAWLFDQLNERFAFTLDVCAAADNAKCARYFTEDDDALTQEWSGACWMNPPYGRGLDGWLAKARAEVNAGRADLVACLIPARTDTRWWHEHVEGHAAEVHFIPGRLRFEGTQKDAPFPSVLVVYRRPLVVARGGRS